VEAEPVELAEPETAVEERVAPASEPVAAEAAAEPIVEAEPMVEMPVPAVAAEEVAPAPARGVWTRPADTLPNVICVKVNPIRGTVHTHGGLAETWTKQNPLRPRRTSPLH
jgi:hypothetical protein